MRQIISSRHVKASFIPEKRKVQQGQVQYKNRNKDQRKDASDGILRPLGFVRSSQWSCFSQGKRRSQLLIHLVLLLGGHGRIKLDLAERALILAYVLIKNREQRFGLLRAEVNSLEVLHLDLLRTDRLQASKHQEKIPHAYTDLDRVSVGITVVFRID